MYAAEFNSLRQNPDDLRAVFARVRQACEGIGRDPDDVTYSAAVVVCCGEDEETVTRRIASAGQAPEKLERSGAAGQPDEVVEVLGSAPT